MKTKISLLLLAVVSCTTFFITIHLASAQYHNYERLLGKKNPYVSEVRGDSVLLYQRTDTALHLLDKIETQKKILLDLRVVNRNQTTLEVWLGISVLLNLICIFILFRIFRVLRNH